MGSGLRLLVIDDSADDVRLLTRQLHEWYPDLECHQVDAAGGLAAALRRPGWDLVVCDHGLPGLPTAEAITRVRAAVPGLPVVVVSGADLPSAPAIARQAGAIGFVRKDRVADLRALIDTVSPRAPARAPAPAIPDADWRAVFECLFDGILISDGAGTVRYANWRAATLSGGTPQDLVGRPVPLRLAAPCVDREIITGQELTRADGRVVPVDVSTAVLAGPSGPERLWVIRDLTVHRRVRERLEQQSRHARQRAADAARYAGESALLVEALRLAGRCAVRMLHERTVDDVGRAVRDELRAATSLGWTDAAIWMRQASDAEDAAHVDGVLTGLDVLARLGGEGAPAIPVAGEHPYARAVQTGALDADRDGELIAPLRARVGVRGVLALTWDPAAAHGPGSLLRASLCEVAGGIADSLGLVIEWHSALESERRGGRRNPLAALADAPAMVTALRASVARCAREGRRLSVLSADCDGVHALNGHAAPGAVPAILRDVAQAIRETGQRPEDAFRTGDTTFLVLLPGMGAGTAGLVAGRLRRRLARALLHRSGVRPPFAVGVVTQTADEQAEALLARADACRRGGA